MVRVWEPRLFNELAPAMLPLPVKVYCNVLLLTVTLPGDNASARKMFDCVVLSLKSAAEPAKKFVALPWYNQFCWKESHVPSVAPVQRRFKSTTGPEFNCKETTPLPRSTSVPL